jgi:hypothetical protein
MKGERLRWSWAAQDRRSVERERGAGLSFVTNADVAAVPCFSREERCVPTNSLCRRTTFTTVGVAPTCTFESSLNYPANTPRGVWGRFRAIWGSSEAIAGYPVALARGFRLSKEPPWPRAAASAIHPLTLWRRRS